MWSNVPHLSVFILVTRELSTVSSLTRGVGQNTALLSDSFSFLLFQSSRCITKSESDLRLWIY